MSRFAVTDIHGCLASFQMLLKKIEFSKADQLYLLGDYIDRGPDSKGVIDFILQLKADGYQVHCILGNHEQAMLRSRTDRSFITNWLTWGGKETLESFGCFTFLDIAQHYWDFLAGLPYYIDLDDYFLVHAGLNFEIDNPLEDKKAMLWIRRWYEHTNLEWLNGRTILHGHTPILATHLLKQRNELGLNGYLDLDNGCVYKHHEGKGNLCAFNMDTKDVTWQKCIDEVHYTWAFKQEKK